ncbi:hypothetical protein NQ176_g8517 [Zarea fungicola]|uniref:Uncharacterized protein n=1 Tax=Zarea fungicola TaxID=93591 RepID=A0ACC1MTZ2_9HYPO|nr:hypothetical protein NQ176_g8517 [Lecanicillium fungicola]
MVDKFTGHDASFFAAPDPTAVLAVEIQKAELRLKALKSMLSLSTTLQKTLNEIPRRSMIERAARLGKMVNDGSNPTAVQELKKMNFEQLCFLAKGYSTVIESDIEAGCIQVFMCTHGATVDNAARQFVKTAATRAAGRFLEIFKDAERSQSDNTAATLHESALIAIATMAQPASTIPMLIKTDLPALFHQDIIDMMMKDKSWGWREGCCNIKLHVYTGGDYTEEWRIEVPRGIDPRSFKVFAEQSGWGVARHDTVDVIVVVKKL